VVAGLLDENIPTVLRVLDDKLSPTETTGKFPLGYSHIDNCVTVGRQNLKFIGILGMSGDGKTTLTNSIVYNWLTQGAHILYCSTEHSPTEIWEQMAFLHQSHPKYNFTLPPMQDWEQGISTGKVTVADKTNMCRILDDIQCRKNLPGLLDCQQFRDWETIKNYLTVNNKKNKYDIIVVDYLGRLDVPGDARFRDNAVKAMIHDAQKLTREFNDNRGLILLSPIQVNREGHKKALNAEEGEARYDINAISQFSEYQHDLDLLLSIWSDDAMKMDNECEIQTLKKRKGRQPSAMRMRINPNSSAVEYTPEYRVATQCNTPAQDRTIEEMAISTEDISYADWGL
jgi:ABC-type dipeptide/oligopeptide/nickel transport system ATPase subunit